MLRSGEVDWASARRTISYLVVEEEEQSRRRHHNRSPSPSTVRGAGNALFCSAVGLALL